MPISRRSTSLGVLGLLPSAATLAATGDALREYEAASGGHVGVYGENVTSGAKLAWRADERFVMCSTFKASLAALILHQVDKGEDHLNIRIC